MDAAKMFEVVARYRAIFEKGNVPKIRFPHKHFVVTVEQRKIESHCHYMLDEIDKFVSEGRTEKAFRWLGFVQGVLWILGKVSLEDLKNHNRPDDES